MKKFFLVVALLCLISSITVVAITGGQDAPPIANERKDSASDPIREIKNSLIGEHFFYDGQNGKIEYIYCPERNPKCPGMSESGWWGVRFNAAATAAGGGGPVLQNLEEQLQKKIIELMAAHAGRVLAGLPNNEDTSVCYNKPRADN